MHLYTRVKAYNNSFVTPATSTTLPWLQFACQSTNLTGPTIGVLALKPAEPGLMGLDRELSQTIINDLTEHIDRLPDHRDELIKIFTTANVLTRESNYAASQGPTHCEKTVPTSSNGKYVSSLEISTQDPESKQTRRAVNFDLKYHAAQGALQWKLPLLTRGTTVPTVNNTSTRNQPQWHHTLATAPPTQTPHHTTAPVPAHLTAPTTLPTTAPPHLVPSL